MTDKALLIDQIPDFIKDGREVLLWVFDSRNGQHIPSLCTFWDGKWFIVQGRTTNGHQMYVRNPTHFAEIPKIDPAM